MRSYEKQIIQSGLDNEKFTLARLKAAYKDALEEVKDRVAILQSREQTQSVIYQLKYQQELEKQLKTIYDKMYKDMHSDVESYLKDCYTDGFAGALYSLHQQGIPLVFPINQEEVAQMAGQTTGNIKLSDRLYVNKSKTVRDVRDVITRGLATNSTYADIARNIAKVSEPTVSQAYRIARTEGHRIQNEVNYKTLQKAKDSGADIVKQWDATIDKHTRPHHAELDGQIRELDEPFEVAGRTALYAGGFGIANEDICCRCAVLQRARWALDKDELETLKDRAEYFGLDKSRDFKDFKKKLLKITEKEIKKVENILFDPIDSKDPNYKYLMESLEGQNVDYLPVVPHDKALSATEIIKKIAGGDRTRGSCASLGLAYIGQRQGWSVFDFRGGKSQHFFSNSLNLKRLSKVKGAKTLKAQGASSITVGNRLLQQCEVGKEYYLCVGRHTTIVRKLNDGTLQYLELQSEYNSGWQNFDGNPRYTLKQRFGCSSSSDGGVSSMYDFMIDIDDSDFNNDDFKSLLGFINTAEDAQRKGKDGTIK